MTKIYLFTPMQARERLQRYIDDAGGIKAAASLLKVSDRHLYQVLKGDRTGKAIFAKLGLEQFVCYREASNG